MRRIALTGFLLSFIFFLNACQKPAYKTPVYSNRQSGEHSLLSKLSRAEEIAKRQAPRREVSDRPTTVLAEAKTSPEETPAGKAPARKPQKVQEKPALPQRPGTQANQESEEAEGEKRYVALNFDNADVYDFIQSIAEITGINYIMAPGVAGRITVQTSGKIPVEEILKLMDTILEVYNLAAVKTGDIYKIVPIEQAKKVGPEIRTGPGKAAIPYEDRVIVQVVKLNYLSPARTTEMLQPFLSVHGEVVPFPLMNVLVIIDSASTIRRLLSFINLFDVDLFKNLGVRLIPVKHIVPSDLAKELQQIFSALGIGQLSVGGGIETIPFDRLNSILLIAATQKLLKSAEDWLGELDKPSEEAGIQTYVYYVENGEATNIAGILNQLYTGQETRTTRPAPRQPSRTKPAATLGKKQKTKTAVRKPGVIHRGQLTELITGEVKIVADEATNALIIQSTPRDYRIIAKTIKELDLRPKQVLIEVLIAEVTLTKGLDFGVQWTLGHANKSGSTAGAAKSLFVPAEGVTDITSFRNFFSALAAGTTGFTYSLASGNELFVMLNALATVTDVDILSSPNILASDNKEASINVGDEVPVVTSEQLPVGTEQTRFRNIQYRQTGVTLTVTPHVNSKDLVTIDVKQEVSEVAAGGVAAVQAETPTISTRNVETTIVVRDGQTILLGGLISRNKQSVKNKVPFLGDIPIIGNLFKTSSQSYRRRELILLITPRVISNDEEAENVTSEFSDRIESLKARMEVLRHRKR